MLTLRIAKFVALLVTADGVICDHAVRLSKACMLTMFLNYSIVIYISSNKFEVW